MNFEYVASGTSYMRMGYKESILPEYTEIFNRHLSLIRKYCNIEGHQFSLLYNAWTETTLGENISNHYSKSIDSIYADSGGLQIVTCGKCITEDMKIDVYKHQSSYANYGMCFDEIPLQILSIGGKSKRNDIATRLFDITKMKHAATLTGKNITEQIKTYLIKESGCKPVLIIQGNCYETYLMWYEYVMSEVPQELHSYIGAIAISGAASGSGMLEDIERAMVYSQLNSPSNHLHLLGCGSINRMLPFIIMKKNGILQDVKISYDSTTHTSAPYQGRYFYNGGKVIDFGRNMNPKYELIYSDIKTKIPDFGLNLTEFHIALNGPAKKHPNISHIFESFMAIIGMSIINFVSEVNRLTNSDLIHEQKFDNNLLMLYDVKTVEDYKYWRKHIGKYVQSKKVSKVQPSLTNFLKR